MHHTRTDGGWIRAGLAVLVTGVLGGGVLTVARDQSTPRRVTADGMTGPRRSAAAEQPLDVATTPPSADDRAKADPVVGDKVTVGSDGGSVTISAVEDRVSAGQLFGAGPGQKYVAAEVKGCSGPHEKNLSFEPGYFMLRLDDGTMRDHGPGAKKPELATGGMVPPGKCLSGWVTFTVPEKALATGVVYDGSHRMVWTVPLPKGARPTTTTTARAGATTTTTDGSDTTPTTKPKATTTTTARGAATARAGAATTTTAKPAATTTTTAKGTTTTATTGKPAGSTTTTTTTPKATTTTTGPGAVATTPTAPTG
jgi:hypothetical protein